MTSSPIGMFRKGYFISYMIMFRHVTWLSQSLAIVYSELGTEQGSICYVKYKPLEVATMSGERIIHE